MSPFGFFPGKQLTSEKPPRGYGAALARVGSLEESVFCSLSRWKLEDYVAHWRRTAESALEGVEPHLFCTDLTRINASLFAAFPDGEAFLFQQYVVPRRSLAVEGRLLRMIHSVSLEPGASTWRVSPEDLRAYLTDDK